MFVEPAPTQYDLKFSVFRIPVSVHPGFWLMGVLMAARYNRIDFIVVSIACVFVSILVHELGHAVVMKSYGWAVRISLNAMGGLAIPAGYYSASRSRQMWISFAGPLAGFALFGLVIAADIGLVAAAQTSAQIRLLLSEHSVLTVALSQLEFINLYWGLVNLLPVMPLDGGRICAEYLHAPTSYKGKRITHQIGMIVGAVVALMFFQSGSLFAAILFGSLAGWNYQQLQQSNQRFY